MFSKKQKNYCFDDKKQNVISETDSERTSQLTEKEELPKNNQAKEQAINDTDDNDYNTFKLS